ncbi:MAG TPA: protoheme IX farnesyltransferase, partial [Flavobacteriales bacterium]|nr:protoheme IX farnesyltransferase [Flavobacteriales bacterium]
MSFTSEKVISDKSFFAKKIAVYAAFTKMRLASLVVLSAVLGYLIGADNYQLNDILVLSLGGFLVTGSSNAFNQIMEKDLDALMNRTKNRPLPTNRLNLIEGYWFASIIGLAGILLLWFYFGALAGILATLALGMYVLIYTPLKRISPIAVFAGAFPGAIPPMLGWVAATGHFGLEAGLLFLTQFFWQFPHFWA